MGKFEASAGFKALGNGASIGFNAALKASVDHSSGQVDTAIIAKSKFCASRNSCSIINICAVSTF